MRGSDAGTAMSGAPDEAPSIGDVVGTALALADPDGLGGDVGRRIADHLGAPPPVALEVLHCRLDVPRRARRAATARLEIGWRLVGSQTEASTDVYAIVQFDGSAPMFGPGSVTLPDLGLSAWRFPLDPHVTGLESVLLPRESRGAMCDGDARVVSYSPLRGCTAWHGAGDGIGPASTERYGKAWADPRKAAGALRAIAAVAGAVPIPRLISASVESATMWTEALPGTTLREAPADRAAVAYALARTLAAVHGATVADLATITSDEVIKRSHNKLRRVELLVGEFETIRRVDERLEHACASIVDVERFVTSMGDCHGGQFIVGGDVVSVVDLDSFAASAPEHDLAEFVASILDGPDRWRTDAFEFASGLLAAYEAASATRLDRERFRSLLIAERIARIYRIAQSLRPGWAEQVVNALAALAEERIDY